ncbi:MAG: superoxide dismutase [Cu-Zn] SodC2, partial [Deltaproteobacteria bacterium]|nr:superoxide dismutase [Cu-Zn] SodC2 [Deltaproteobacteria bacterium]
MKEGGQKMKKIILVMLVVMISAGLVMAAEKTIPMNLVNDQGMGEAIGVITVQDTKYGLLLTPQLNRLPPGIHGFHVHQNADCGHMMTGGKAMAAGAAGGHFDPTMTGKHDGPY